MKTLTRIFFMMAVAGLFFACEKPNDFFEEEAFGLKMGNPGPVTVTVPFKSDFTVWNHSDYTYNPCAVEGEPWIVFLTMIGEGVATHLGKLTVTMTFCCNGITGEYWNTDVIFVAANGDELYGSIPIGYIVENDEENSNRYGAKFNDPMYFTGGTGRFEGASGMVMTNAYVHDPRYDEYVHNGDEVWHTDFFSKGTITMKKGKP